jgi:glutaconate CoA-transferase, subunit A
VAPDKVVSLSDAVDLISDGDVVALQNMATQAAPMAMVRELIRRERRGLTVVALVGGMAIDWLAAAGCLNGFIGAAVSMEQFGLCHQFRRAVESGAVRVEELSETALLARLGAGARGLPFLPTRGLIGTDLIGVNPENLVVIDDPFGGPPVVACRALVPDVALVHAHRADRAGNIAADPTIRFPDSTIFPKASRTVIVTVEEIVDTDVLRRDPDRTVLPGFAVDAVVEVPYGAHPTSLYPKYTYDTSMHQEWVSAARDDARAQAFLDRYVRTPSSQVEYLDVAGGATRLIELVGAVRG